MKNMWVVKVMGNGQTVFNSDYALNSVVDFGNINISELITNEILRYHFSDLGLAFSFYNWYGSLHDFSARKSKILWDVNGEAMQQTFLCHKQGHRDKK